MASGFAEGAFKGKLERLLDTQESIETLSHWVLFHARFYKHIAATWCEYFFGLSPLDFETEEQYVRKLLTLLFLVNDAVQNGLRKGVPEYAAEFGAVLPSAMQHLYIKMIACDLDEQEKALVMKRIGRMVGIWTERRIFPDKVISDVCISMPQQLRVLAEIPQENSAKEFQLFATIRKQMELIESNSASKKDRQEFVRNLIELQQIEEIKLK